MNAKVEPGRDSEAVLYEAPDHYSNDEVTVGTAADLAANTVVGKITSSGKYVAYNPGASDGSETAAGMIRVAAAAAAADVVGVRAVVRHARLNRAALQWGAGVTTAQHRTDAIADLKALGVLVTDAH